MHLLLVEAILEDIFSDMVKKYPHQESNLTVAKKRGVKPKYFQWLAKMMSQTMEPIHDVIPLITAFDAKQQQIQAKFGGSAGDINSYKTIADLSNRLESLDSSVSNQSLGEILYQDETWLVIFPRSTEESCASGKNTSWCTARTQSSNLFLSYTGRNDGIFLFYVINKTKNPRTDANAKISIGFNKGVPVFDGSDGGMTVNGQNDGITQEEFKRIVGSELSEQFLAIMSKKVTELDGKHPATNEVQQIANDYNRFIAKIKTFKHSEEREDFLELIMNQKTVSPQVLEWFMQDYDGKRALLDSSKIIHTTPEILAKLGGDEDREVRAMVAKNRKTPQQTLINLLDYDDPRINYAMSKNVGAGQALVKLFHADGNADYVENISANPSASPSLLRTIYTHHSHDPFVLVNILHNPNTPEDIIAAINKSKIAK